MPQARKPPPEGSDAWVPADVGDKLWGEVIDVDTAWSDWRAQRDPSDPDAGWYPLLTIRQDDGTEVKLHGFRTVLFSELVKREPVVGETVVVTYLGPGEAKEGGKNPPELFKVRVEGRSPESGKALYRSLRSQAGRLGPTPAPDEPPATQPVDPDAPPF